MFLYARLVCDNVGLLGDLESIKEAVENLPGGLNEASVHQTNLNMTHIDTNADTTESFPGLQKVYQCANARMLARFWRLSLVV